jgi:hypothetical protein
MNDFHILSLCIQNKDVQAPCVCCGINRSLLHANSGEIKGSRDVSDGQSILASCPGLAADGVPAGEYTE